MKIPQQNIYLALYTKIQYCWGSLNHSTSLYHIPSQSRTVKIKGHDIKTCMATVRKASGEIDLTSIFNKVKGLSHINPYLPALKYIRSMESDAARYIAEIFMNSHRNVIIKEYGLFLCEEIPFVGGIPDRIVECDCCGKSCLEIKCPFSIRHLSSDSPEANLPYIKRQNNMPKLSTNLKYYTQCQIQMAATKLQKCYFFVWTAHGSILQECNKQILSFIYLIETSFFNI